MMTIEQTYHETKKQRALGDTALKILLCHANGFGTFNELFIHWNDTMVNSDQFKDWVARVESGEPVQYVINEAYFLARPYFVDESVLIPRPETEEMVTMAIAALKGMTSCRIVDLGTGSGCIAISLKLAFPTFEVLASDISTRAIEVARRNAETHQAAITIYQGDWLLPLIERNVMVDVVICNPPYIANRATVAPDVCEYEPHLALFAKDGIEHHCRIINQAASVLRPHGIVMLEIDEDQGDLLVQLATKSFEGAKIEISKDLQGKNRFLTVRLP